MSRRKYPNSSGAPARRERLRYPGSIRVASKIRPPSRCARSWWSRCRRSTVIWRREGGLSNFVTRYGAGSVGDSGDLTRSDVGNAGAEDPVENRRGLLHLQGHLDEIPRQGSHAPVQPGLPEHQDLQLSAQEGGAESE